MLCAVEKLIQVIPTLALVNTGLQHHLEFVDLFDKTRFWGCAGFKFFPKLDILISLWQLAENTAHGLPFELMLFLGRDIVSGREIPSIDFAEVVDQGHAQYFERL